MESREWETDDKDGDLVARVTVTDDWRVLVNIAQPTMDVEDADHFRMMLGAAIGRARWKDRLTGVPWTASGT